MKNISRMICYVSTLFVILALPNMITAQDPVVLCSATIGCNDCSVVTEVFDNNTYTQTITCGEDVQTHNGSGAYCGIVCGFSACNTEVCEAD